MVGTHDLGIAWKEATLRGLSIPRVTETPCFATGHGGNDTHPLLKARVTLGQEPITSPVGYTMRRIYLIDKVMGGGADDMDLGS